MDEIGPCETITASATVQSCAAAMNSIVPSGQRPIMHQHSTRTNRWGTSLLAHIPADQNTASVTADGAYGTRKCHKAIAERGAAAVILPRKNAKLWKAVTEGAVALNEALRASKYLGSALCRRWSGHHR